MGFQPNISLSYNSQAGNGVVGMGWSISGLSSIERVNKNMFFDGKTDVFRIGSEGSPIVNDGDFALDGVRLIEISRSTTQIVYESSQGNIKVIAIINYNISGSHSSPVYSYYIDYFKVLYPNGSIGIFGSESRGQVSLSAPLTKLTDINGNVITFSYTFDTADLNSGSTNETYYIDEINYGQCGTTPNFAKIKFSYDATRPDQIFSLQSTKSCVYRKRLSKIESFANPDLIRTYQLTYSNTDPRIPSNQNDVSRLTQISSFANNGTSVTDNLNPLKFYYGEAGSLTTSMASTTLGSSNFDLTKINVVRGKFDTNIQNDALLVYPKKDIYANGSTLSTFSLAYPSQENIKVYQNLNSSSSTPFSLTSEQGFLGIYSANIDGVGLDELIKINSTGVSQNSETLKFKIYKPDVANGIIFDKELDYIFNVGFLPSDPGQPLGTTVIPKEFYTGNFTGQGKTEILCVPKRNIFSTNVTILNLENNITSPVFSGDLFPRTENDLVFAVDIDGDGQTELVHVTSSQTDLYKYKLSSGSMVNIGNWTLTTADFMSKISSGNFINENGGISGSTQWTYDNQVFFADVNGDGKIDIIKAPQRIKRHYNYSKVSVRTVKCIKCGALYGKFSSCQNGCPLCGDRSRINDLNDFCIYVGSDHHYPLSNWWQAPIINKDQIECGNYDWIDSQGNQHLIQNTNVQGKCPVHGCVVDVEYDWNYEEHDDWTIFFTDGINTPFKKNFQGPVCNGDSKIFIQDTDGDNVPELIVDGELYAYRDKEHVFDTDPFISTNITYGSEIIPFDINSDKSYNQLVALNPTGIEKVSFSQNRAISNQISLMTNSLGIADKTNYDQLYQGANYTPGTAAMFPNNDFQGPLWVTTQTSAMYNKQLISNATYNYNGAILHKQGLGLRGFTSMRATDLMTNKVTTTEFNPYQMGAITHQVSDSEESSFIYSFTDFDSSPMGNKKMKLLLTNKTLNDKLKGNTVTVDYSNYDSYGNAKSEVTNYGGVMTSTVTNTFDNRIGTTFNLIGLLTNRVTTNTRGTSTLSQTEEYVYPTDNRLHFARKYVGANIIPANMITETEYKYNADYGTVSDEIVHNIPTSDYLTTSYTYDTDNCSLLTKTDPMGLKTEYTNNLNLRLLTGVKDYLGNTVTYGYDNWRRKNSEVSTVGADIITTSSTLSWNTESDPNKLFKETSTTSSQSGTTVQPATTLYTDAFGHETRKTITGFDGIAVYADKQYDTFGRLQGSTAPYKTSPLWTTYGYDEFDRPTSVVQPNGSITCYTYDGNKISENKDGITTSKTTDATGKLVSSTDGGGMVSYTYRADGQPDNVNAAGVVTGFEYNDPYNRQTKLIDPSAGTVQTAYNDLAHTVTQTWNSGKVITTVSNKYGQPITKTTPDFTTTYTYDPAYGRPTGSTSSNGTSKSIEYDTYGRLWKSTETLNSKSYQEVYGCDNGRIGSVMYNTGTGTTLTNLTSVQYKYNGNGYLYQLTDGSNNVLRQVNSVNELGQETSILLGNGLTTTKNYTPEGLWTNVTTSNSSNVVHNMNYDFNRLNGTLNSRTDNVHNMSESFTYDNLYRLKTAGPSTSRQTIDYYDNGNIKSKTDGGIYAYNETGKPYTLSSVTNPDWDETPQLNVDYTVMSRPKTISNANGLKTTFTYNDDYDRVYTELKDINNTVFSSKYYFAGGKYELENGTQRLYVDGTPYTASIIMEKTGSSSPQIYYIHRDYLGSVMQITNNIGNLADENSYDAWGVLRDPATWYPLTVDRKPAPMFGRGFTGHEYICPFIDDNGGRLINMNARLYDPLLGRFLAPDPYVSSGMTNDFNRYIYARNNPMMYTDPSGMSFADWWNRNIAVPFMREANSVFGNGQGGWEIGYNSSGGFFTNPTYNGKAFGPSVYYNLVTNQWDAGIGSGGFHNKTSSVRIDNNVAKTVVEAEQSARGEYFEQKGMNGNNGFVNFFSNYSNILGSITSPLQTWTQAGQGLYTTSKGIIRNIDFKNITRNSSTNAQTYTGLKYLGYVGLSINLYVDGYYNPSIGNTNGIETFYNVSVDIGGYYMGPFGLIFTPVMKEYPNTLKSHPEFIFLGSDEFLK